MKENVITVLSPYNIDFSKAKSTFDATFRSLCHQYGLKFQYVNGYELFSGNVSIFEPFLLYDNFSPRFLELLEKLSPRQRIIITTNTIKGLHQYVSVISCAPIRIAGEVFSYCLAAGRRRLALFAYDRFGLNTRSYIDAYKEIAELYGCCFDKDDAFLNDENMLSDCFSRFYEKCGEYDAVACANDMSALYLITELRERGVRVPEDLFVFGFGNSPLSTCTTPSITTFNWSEKEKAEQCIALWRYLKKYPEISSVDITIGHQMLVGESTDNFIPVAGKRTELTLPLSKSIDRGYENLGALHYFLQKADETEKGIVSGLLAGKNNIEIGSMLFLTESSVKYHVNKLLQKFGVSSRKELCRIFQRYNLKL